MMPRLGETRFEESRENGRIAVVRHLNRKYFKRYVFRGENISIGCVKSENSLSVRLLIPAVFFQRSNFHSITTEG